MPLRYIQNTQTGEFVGEAAFRYDSEYGMHVISIIVEANYRGKGFGRAGLRLLMEAAKENGIDTLAIVNRRDSSIAREAGKVLYVKAGPEIAVASTKAYTSQVVLLNILAIYFAEILPKTIFPCQAVHQNMQKTR